MIVLASASPRRKEILSALGIKYTVAVSDVDERSQQSDPRILTEELARRKGLAVYEAMTHGEYGIKNAADAVIISADTVVYANGKILGKPHDAADALSMLRSLSGASHEVITGIALTINGKVRTASCTTKVNVADIPDSELIAYAHSQEPLDKAGAYAVQGRFSIWISSIEGCYFNVVGLPVNLLNSLYFECTGKYLV